MTMTPPGLSTDRAALLLDFDGTLVDIAPTPESVVVVPSLLASLASLRDRLGGALAIVSGRPLSQIDHFLPGIPYAVAAEHGAVIRHAPGEEPERVALAAVPGEWTERAEAYLAAHDGSRLERKSTGFVLHYRGAPDAGPALNAFLRELIGDDTERFHVLPAKMAWELRASGADKGSAVDALMERPPFRGRQPMFIGDDVTDLHGIEAAQRLGGSGFLVPDSFGEPEDVRAWLDRCAADRSGHGG